MIHKNRYINNSKISEAKFREIIKYFVADLSATQINELSGVSRELLWRAKRVRAKRCRGAYGKTIVFGLLKRGGKVYTEIVPNFRSKNTIGYYKRQDLC